MVNIVAQIMSDSTLLSQGAICVVRTSGRLLRPTFGAHTVKQKPEFHNFKIDVRRMMSKICYDFSNPCVLGNGEGILAPLESVTREVMESTWFTTDQGLHNFTSLQYQPTHSNMISSESAGSTFFENGTYEDNVQSHAISIVGPYLPPPPPGPIVSDGVPNVKTFNDTVKTMMRKLKEDWLKYQRLGLSPHGLGYVSLDLSSSKKYEEETDRDSSYTESWDSNSCIPELFPLAVSCTTARPSTTLGNEEKLIERQNQTLVGELQERWPIDEPQPLTKSCSQLKWPCRSAQRIIVNTIAWPENLNRVPPINDDVRQVDLGTEGYPRPIFLSANLSTEEAEQYVQILKEYLDKFAWNYAEMPGLDPKITVYWQNIKPDAKPFKQVQRSILNTTTIPSLSPPTALPSTILSWCRVPSFYEFLLRYRGRPPSHNFSK
ncbi:hypothetical protein NE237_003969 [Protea cynaroides]|uniref:Uncharacterized protein n=1 Tax=Protea cynaroides TaxID=273540 RepID=A0A9Q0QSX7_9MAGN|nr:hypothetical protein NE237_003969 [Protea cynaroides]